MPVTFGLLSTVCINFVLGAAQFVRDERISASGSLAAVEHCPEFRVILSPSTFSKSLLQIVRF